MQVRDMVQALTDKGHLVTYYVRPDGGLRITSIDGERFSISGNAGNERARKILGTSLSARQKSQRATAALEAKQGHLVTSQKPRLSKSEKKALKKANVALKKLGKEKIGAKQARQSRGRSTSTKEFVRKLKSQVRHHIGIAYSKNVEWLISWLELKRIFPKVREWLKDHISTSLISDSALASVHEEAYNVLNNIYDERTGEENSLRYLSEGKRRIESVLTGYFKRYK